MCLYKDVFNKNYHNSVCVHFAILKALLKILTKSWNSTDSRDILRIRICLPWLRPCNNRLAFMEALLYDLLLSPLNIWRIGDPRRIRRREKKLKICWSMQGIELGTPGCNARVLSITLSRRHCYDKGPFKNYVYKRRGVGGQKNWLFVNFYTIENVNRGG